MVSFPRVPCETIMLLRRNRRGNCSRPMGVALVCAIQSRWVVGEPWIFLSMVSVTIDCVSKSIVSPLCSQPGERARERERKKARESRMFEERKLDGRVREKEGGKERERTLKYGTSNWLRHIEFGSMGSRVYRALGIETRYTTVRP